MAEMKVTICYDGDRDGLCEYITEVAEMIQDGFTSGLVGGGSGRYWDSEGVK